MNASRLALLIATSLRNHVSLTALLGAFLALAITVLAGAWLAPPASSAVLNDEDWESGVFPPPGWGFCHANSTLSVTTEDHLTATHALKMAFSDADNPSGGGDCISFGYPGTDHLFWRVGIKVAPGFIAGSNRFTKIFFFGAVAYPGILLELAGSDAYATTFWPHFQVYAYDSFGQFEIKSPLLSDGKWHQFEVEILLNTPGVSNGLYRIWIDNVLWIESLNRQIRGPLPTSKELSGNLYPTPSTAQLTFDQIYRQSGRGTLYVDRVAIGDTRIGVVGTLPASAPSVPLGVQLR